MHSFVTANGKAFHTNLDNLVQLNLEYDNDAYIEIFKKENSDHSLTEFENFLYKRLKEDELVFTQKISFIRYDNNIESLV